MLDEKVIDKIKRYEPSGASVSPERLKPMTKADFERKEATGDVVAPEGNAVLYGRALSAEEVKSLYENPDSIECCEEVE